MGLDERYKLCKIKVFVYLDKWFIWEFDDFDRDMKLGVSIFLNG